MIKKKMNKLLVIIRIIMIRSKSATSKSVIMMFGNDFEYLEYALEKFSVRYFVESA